MIYKNYDFLTKSKGKGARSSPVKMDPIWVWISMVDRLANGDITKHEQIYNMNYLECLNLLALWNARDEYNEREARIQSRLDKQVRNVKNKY